MITKESHFVNDIYISQVGSGSSSVVNNSSTLSGFIKEHEPELLETILGKKLSDEFRSNLDVNGDLNVGADIKWDHLLNGYVYNKGGIDYYWRGLVETKGAFKKSLTAYYVYYKYTENEITQRTTLGTVKAKAGNANTIDVSALPSLSLAWQNMYEWIGDEYYCYSGVSYYHRGVRVYDYSLMNGNSKNVSFYTFMTDNKTDYDDWFFTGVGDNKNQFDL